MLWPDSEGGRMPEGPEVETERLHETIHEELEHEGGAFLRRIALTTALFAALAAIAALRAGAAVNEASRTSWLAIAKEPPPEYAANQKKYADEQAEIQKKARELEKERDAKSTEADELLHHH